MHNTAPQDWQLREWMAYFGITQASLERKTGWSKRKASELVNGGQPYKRDSLNQAAHALGIEPFELLMLPDEAMLMRNLRDYIDLKAAEQRQPWRGQDKDEPLRRKAS